jgi:3-oxoacid CoA-transferase subunit A
MIQKIHADGASAIRQFLRDGMSIAVGGFGLCGIPETLIEAVRQSGVSNLTIVSNNAGIDNFGLGTLLRTKQVSKMVSSYVGENREFERQYLSGEIEIEFCPQGTLAERMRAGGAGIAAFYTKAGVGTLIADGKETRTFDGELHLLESGIRTDLALVKAWKGDPYGNLVYRKSARNFNPMVATCGRITIAEVEELVGPGDLGPDLIHTPSIYVQRLIAATRNEKRIEQRTISRGVA